MTSSASSSSSPRPSKSTTEQRNGSTTSSRLLSFIDRLPLWISANLRAKKSWKMLARCWLASWIAFVVLLPEKSVRTLGNAAFFALLGSMFVPPNMPLQIFLFALFTIVLGVCLGWAFGAAAMHAALAARSQTLLRAALQKEAQSTAGLANPDALFQASIFEGVFLDTRSSAIFGAFLGVGVFFFALIRAYAPRLIITSVFATIAIDIFCSYGPLFPFAEYTLMNSLLTSLACYIAIGVVVIIFIFPESLNHAVLTSTSGLLSKVKSLIDMQEDVLNAPISDLVGDGPVLTRVTGTRVAIVAGLQGLKSQLPMLNLEFNWGRWNGDDVKGLDKHISTVIPRLAAVQSFVKLLGTTLDTSSSPSRASGSEAPTQDASYTTGSSGVSDTELLRQLRSRHHAHSMDIPPADLVPILRDATRRLRAACASALAACISVIDVVNTKRYARGSSAELDSRAAELDTTIEQLSSALTAFKDSDRLALLEPFRDILEAERARAPGDGKGEPPLRSLCIMYVFAANMVIAGQAIKALGEYVSTTAHKRRRNRLWAPKGLRMIGKVLMQRGTDSEGGTGEDPVSSQEKSEKDENPYKTDPDAMPPSNIVQKLANKLHVVYLWTKTPEAMFAFKYTAVTIALWIPSVVKTSASESHVQKRMPSLDKGLGSAKSRGSPYGMAASAGVFLIPLVFCRVFAPVQYLPGVLMVCATWTLIVGYSWLDGHIHVLGDVGIGWPVAWRRWVLVMIGCAASFIMMILPPTSARKSVRLRCASIMSSLSHLYSHLMAAWIDEVVPTEDGKEGMPRGTEWVQDFREKIIAVAQQLQALKMQAAIARFEGNIRGAWPSKEYNKLVEVETEMTANLAMLAGSLVQLDHGTKVRLLRHTRVVNPNFISEVVSMFLHISQSLRTAEPLHQAQKQNLVDRVFYHSEGPYLHTVDEDAEAMKPNHVESVMSYDFMFYASGVVAVFQLLQNINEARNITARLCGEVRFEGFEEWREKYGRNRAPVVSTGTTES
ncbi:predicted protein [Postia placenta Mad-698-R]|uniref:ER transporter 6TM N-terminal domain-containing protein n=1 Tax=Postia placenta MAD-698-R-SB12 TaxID=670580 RepID=A0A1X6N0X6_9APHY|nr:hypothetical protein POSPLADRAFT_1181400 [Postia placenta MAD-698-R-SB12]EED82525.1 predicted protein [Postia placenta Mad-698-R]OSX62275.1 hypothetical protein POSPLADRAFT_1181400 [Postia placenta MAD-698-R-SB12]